MIKLTTKNTGNTYINPDHIVEIANSLLSDGSFIFLSIGTDIYVRETPDEVVRKINRYLWTRAQYGKMDFDDT